MSDIQKSPTKPPTPTQLHCDSVGRGMYNRYGILSSSQKRPPPKTVGPRKRPLESDEGPATPGKIPKLDANKVFDQLKAHDNLMVSAKTILTEVGACAEKVGRVDDGVIGSVIYKLCQVIDTVINSQETIKSAMVDLVKIIDYGNLSTTNKKNSKEGEPLTNQGKGGGLGKTSNGAPTEEEIRKAKVKKVLREAERRVIAFDLNLGSAPLINKTTISKNVTVELHNKAKSGNHDWAVDSAAAMVDDVLSCAQLEFLGPGTRKFYNNRNESDARNNKMCTVPVRFDFKNKEQRIQAEKTLKKICQVRTAVPYPKKLRESLAALVEAGKKKAPGKFVMTKVDIDKLTIGAFVRGDRGWVDLNLSKDISSVLIDTSQVTVSEEEMQTQMDEEIIIS